MVLHVTLVALALHLLQCVRCQECPVPHECHGFGYEALSTGTGEAALCLAAGAMPKCPGVDMIGQPFVPGGGIGGGGASGMPGTPTGIQILRPVIPTPRTPTSASSETSASSPGIPTPSETSTSPSETSDSSSGTTTQSSGTTPSSGTTDSSTGTTTSSSGTTDSSTGTTTSSSGTTDSSTGTTTSSSGTTTSSPGTTTPSSETSTQSSESPDPESCMEASCDGRTEGVYGHQYCDCSKYFTCRGRVLGGPGLLLSEYRCFGEEVFDRVSNTCSLDSSKCPYKNT
ncbi:hypothetical protein Pmani_011865 [Petrolisthes manimaculis]|uniref:Chitin-binding type-2 domain-containing protein n=1 Tax=Petrolisthes manimaculis TaxID=1843537 RepID=A0AAE1PZ78_9EUCA|nr:hypothetical protein Pmani_011865 [Petrolisthes manimaculis]